MPSMRWITAGALAVALFAAGAPARGPQQVDWRSLIRPRDRDRLRDWRTSWTAALASARSARSGGAADRIAAEGALLQPDAAIVPPDVPDGDYRCRLIRLGAARPGSASYVEAPVTRCRIRDGRFALLGGLQRPSGRLWRLDGLRLVFLGSIALADEAGALNYGRDPDRDAAGMIERVGLARWRLVLPQPQWQSLLDVIEIVPLSPGPPAARE